MVFTTSDQGITASTAPDSIAAVAKTPREPAEDATTSWRVGSNLTDLQDTRDSPKLSPASTADADCLAIARWDIQMITYSL